MKLPEADAETFTVYVQWAYTGVIVVVDPTIEASDESGAHRYAAITKLNILADQLSNTTLRNESSDYFKHVLKSSTNMPAADVISMIYTKLPETSKLRKLVVDWYIWAGNTEWLKSNSHLLPSDFVLDLAVCWASLARSGRKMPSS